MLMMMEMVLIIRRRRINIIEDHYEGNNNVKIMSHNLENSTVKDIGDVKPLPANWETATAPLKHYTVMPRWKLQCDEDDDDMSERFCCRVVKKVRNIWLYLEVLILTFISEVIS